MPVTTLIALLAAGGAALYAFMKKGEGGQIVDQPKSVIVPPSGKSTITAAAVPLKPSGATKKVTVKAAPLKTGYSAPKKSTSTKSTAYKTTTISSTPRKKTTPTKKVVVTAAPLKPSSAPTAKAASGGGYKTTSVRRAPASTGTTAQKSAAKALNNYLTARKSGNIDIALVKKHQKAMGSLTVDGIPGPLTKKRTEALLGKSVSWVHINAANYLYNYYVKSGLRDKARIKQYQSQMGNIAVDGLVGPETKRRVRQLTDINWR